MDDELKSREQLINELNNLRQRVATLEFATKTTEPNAEKRSLENSDNHLDTLVNVLPGRAVVLSPEGVYVDVIKHNHPEGNYQPDDVIGKSLYDVQNKAFADFCMGKIQAVLASDSVHIFEYGFYNGRGVYVYHEGHVAPLHNTDTDTVNVIWVSRDITKSKQAEIALRESESRLRTVVNSIPDRIVILDCDGVYLDVIKRHIETGNYQPDSVIGKSLHEVQNKAFADFCLATIQKTIETGETQMIEYDLINVRGLPASYQGYISPLYDDESGETRVMWISRDITNSKQAERASRENQQRLRTFVDLLPDRAVIISTEGRYVDVIKHHTAKTSLPEPDELLGKTLHEVMTEAQADFCLSKVHETLATQQTQILEYDLINHNGEHVYFEGRITPWLVGDTDEPRVLWISRNITERKQNEVELARYRDHLETLVQERTAELEQEIAERQQLESAKIRQERLAAVGQLAAGIAHDFNNVMAVIILDSSLALRSPKLTDYERSKLERIQKQARHAANLIDQILDFSRRSVREPVVLDLRILLSELIKFLKRTIPQRIDIDFHYIEGVFNVNVDPTQFQQVITNLAVNARDAIAGQGKLSFDLTRFQLVDATHAPLSEMALGHWVQLDVRDTGTGIKPEHLSKLFEPFFTTKEVGKGTGLGLAQVYGIVHQHDGFITVDTEEGNGTTFTIYLPLATAEASALEQTDEAQFERGTGETILLVEDNMHLLDSIADFLVLLGYRVLKAKNGADALAIFESHPDTIHLVLSDVVMPQMDGIELVRRLKNYLPKPKIIMMSGFHEHKTVTPEIEQVVAAWVQKPLKLSDVSDLICETLVSK